MFIDVNDNLLEDVSYTMSLSLTTKTWDSFHGYIADKLFNTRRNLYSFKSGRIYKHNANNKCIYYEGTKQKCFITPVFTSKDSTFLLNNVYFETDVLNSEGIRINKTFNKIRIVDSYQGTNTITIVPFDTEKSAFENYDVANTRRIKNGWFFNKFRDKKANEFVKNITQTIDNYVYNDVNISNNLEGIRRFNDNYVMFILEYNNNEQHDFFIYSININVNPTKR